MILACHLAADRAGEARRGRSKIGTTQRGIGPAYADRAARTGVRLADTLDRDHFYAQLKTCLDAKRALLPRPVARTVCNVSRVGRETLELLKPLRDLIVDTGVLLDGARRKGKRILFEGAQGAMLDLSAGSYPYVTSSHTLAGGVCVGTGLGPRALDRILGVSKAYATRVGGGPFPTELLDEMGDLLRNAGGEFGSTTGRPRRCGWLDVPALRMAARVNGMSEIALTKLDVLTGLDELKVCVAYELDGEKLLEPPYDGLESVKPIYETLPGWKEDVSGCRKRSELPENAQKYIEAIEKWVGVKVGLVSVGPDRDQTADLVDPF